MKFSLIIPIYCAVLSCWDAWSQVFPGTCSLQGSCLGNVKGGYSSTRVCKWFLFLSVRTDLETSLQWHHPALHSSMGSSPERSGKAWSQSHPAGLTVSVMGETTRVLPSFSRERVSWPRIPFLEDARCAHRWMNEPLTQSIPGNERPNVWTPHGGTAPVPPRVLKHAFPTQPRSISHYYFTDTCVFPLAFVEKCDEP